MLGIRADPSIGTSGFDGGINSAILRYAGADDVDPTSNQTTSVAVLSDANLVVSFSSSLKPYFSLTGTFLNSPLITLEQ